MAVHQVGPVERVGVVGWGRMGSLLGQHLLQRSWRVLATDPDDRARALAERAGAEVVDGAGRVAAGADLLLLVVVDDQQVRQAAAEAIDEAREGAILAVCASVRPDTCRELARQGAARGVLVIDAALVGGERKAEEGALVLYCGGPAAAIEAAWPAMRSFAVDLCHVGEVGAGQVAKAANNILLWACLRADVEAQRLARSLGVEPGRLRAALAVGSGANRPLAEWGRHRLRWPHKDLEIALGLAGEVGLPMPLVEALAPLMDELTVEELDELR